MWLFKQDHFLEKLYDPKMIFPDHDVWAATENQDLPKQKSEKIMLMVRPGLLLSKCENWYVVQRPVTRQQHNFPALHLSDMTAMFVSHA